MSLQKSDKIMLAGVGGMGVLFALRGWQENNFYEKAATLDPNGVEWRERVKEAEALVEQITNIIKAKYNVSLAELLNADKAKVEKTVSSLTSLLNEYNTLKAKNPRTQAETTRFNTLQKLLRTMEIIK